MYACVLLLCLRYNKCEDFYARISAGDIPPHDVLVTNPPYSGDNVERLLAFCKSNDKPFALLMPNWVYMKPYVHHVFAWASTVLYPFLLVNLLQRVMLCCVYTCVAWQQVLSTLFPTRGLVLGSKQAVRVPSATLIKLYPFAADPYMFSPPSQVCVRPTAGCTSEKSK